MNEAEVRAILARAEAATPGPAWQVLPPHPDPATQANRVFLAAARDDVPALAREVLALREALAALCDWHTWPEVAGAFGFVAAHGITVTPQIAEKAGAIWSQAQALLADEEKP